MTSIFSENLLGHNKKLVYLADTFTCGGHWHLCFGFLGDVSSEFQSQSGFCVLPLFAFVEANMIFR